LQAPELQLYAHSAITRLPAISIFELWRRWIARIIISWGVIAASFALVPSISAIFRSLGFLFFDNARTFYLMRFIFGAAEAGFVPGIILYLTYWFTADERARWVGVFLSGSSLALILGGPISGLILDTFDGDMGLGGWQWLFIIEGVPCVPVGLWALRHLTDNPREAAWLEPDERIALQARIDVPFQKVGSAAGLEHPQARSRRGFLVLSGRAIRRGCMCPRYNDTTRAVQSSICLDGGIAQRTARRIAS
jgi:MFS family permease